LVFDSRNNLKVLINDEEDRNEKKSLVDDYIVRGSSMHLFSILISSPAIHLFWNGDRRGPLLYLGRGMGEGDE
jgi:hypothetical protein